MCKLDARSVYEEYAINGKSDTQIAKIFNVHRTAIVKFRKDHLISTRESTGGIGEREAIKMLVKLGLHVQDMNKSLSKTHHFDLLVNEKIRIDVKSAFAHKKRWSFVLTQKDGTGIKESPNYCQLPNGRWKKNFNNSCDFLILCGLRSKETSFFIVPSKLIVPNTINIPTDRLNRWSSYEGRWELFEI